MRSRLHKHLGMWIAAMLSAVAGTALAAVVGSAGADVPSGNVIRNPDAETGGAGTDPGTGVAPPEWERLFTDTTPVVPGGDFEQVRYGFPSFPSRAVGDAISGGNALFTGGTREFFGPSLARQTVSLVTAAPEIDAGRVVATLAAHLGGTTSQTDHMTIDAEFQDAGGTALATLTIGPVTAAERGNATTLLRRMASAGVPPGTRSAVITMSAFAQDNDGNIDAFADNVSLTFRASPLPGRRTPTQLQPGVSAPKLGESFNVVPLRGQVFVSTPPQIPGAASAGARASATSRASATVPGLKGRSFVPLRSVRNIPMGSLLDTRRGAVGLAAARDAGGTIQTGEFSAGVFQVLQSKRRSARGLAELRLKGASFKPCRGRGHRAASSHPAGTSRHSKRSIRRLRGKSNGGRFRTRGRYSAATVRGTDWGTTDRCDGTLTKVRRGRVAVRDFRKRRNVLVRSGKSYLARAPR